MITSSFGRIDEEQARGRTRARSQERRMENTLSNLSLSESNIKRVTSPHEVSITTWKKLYQWPKNRVILPYIRQPRRIIRQVKTATALTIAIFLGTRYAPWFGKYPFLFGTIVSTHPNNVLALLITLLGDISLSCQDMGRPNILHHCRLGRNHAGDSICRI